MYNPEPTYPRAYHQILLKLNEDGTPMVFPYNDAEKAQAERLRFYNFLKWCRRPKNMQSVTHLNGRYNQVEIKVTEGNLVFQLKTRHKHEPIADMLEAMLGADLPPIPPSANPKAFRTDVPAHEARPLAPDLDVNPAPSSFFPKPDWVAAEEQKLVALSAMVASQPREVEIQPLRWFPLNLMKPNAHDFGPQLKMQYIMDKLVFEGDAATLPHPPSPGDSHTTSPVLTTKLTNEWIMAFTNMGWGIFVHITSADGQWNFTLTEQAKRMLANKGLGINVRSSVIAEDDKNKVRGDIIQLFNQEGI